jgi:hypothetical protein
VCVFVATLLTTPAVASAASARISARHGGHVTLRHGLRLVIPRHALKRTATVRVARVGAGYAIRVGAPWRGSFSLERLRHGRYRHVPGRLGGVVLHEEATTARAHAAGLDGPVLEGTLCIDLKEASEGVIEIPAGTFYVLCALYVHDVNATAQVVYDVRRYDALRLARQLGQDCVNVLSQTPDPVPLSVFARPECNPKRGKLFGPSDGTPYVVATLTPTAGPTVPVGPPPTQTPPVQSPPASTGSAPVFPVMNTSETPPDGVWFRRSPHTPDSDEVTGHGVYAGEQVQLQCYAFGDSVGRYDDRLWYLAANVSRPTNAGVANTGFLNAHYINDGADANVVDAGVGPC